MKKKKSVLLPLYGYLVLYILLEIAFWIFRDGSFSVAMLVYFYLFPISIFVVSVLESMWLKSKKKYFLILFFGFSVLLYEYTTFGLSNMIQNGFQTIWTPSIFYFVFYSFLSFAGMVTSYYITKVKMLSSKKK